MIWRTEFTDLAYRLMTAIFDYRKPTVAAVAGARRCGPVDEVVPAGTLRESALRLATQIAEHGAELTCVLKEVALRSGGMDHVAATAYELRVTHDLLQRGLFASRLAEGLDRLKAGQSKATERLSDR